MPIMTAAVGPVVEWNVTVGTIGLAILWTSSIIGAMMWLNTRLNSLLTRRDYHVAHKELEERVRLLELWAARQNGPHQHMFGSKDRD